MLDPEKSVRQPIKVVSPPIAPSEAVQQPPAASIDDPAPESGTDRRPAWQWTLAGIIALVAASGWWTAGSVDQRHANWTMVDQAREATLVSGADAMICRSSQRGDTIVSAILLSNAEADLPLSQEFHTAWQRGNVTAAAKVVQRRLGRNAHPLETLTSSPLSTSVASGRAQFYQLHIADACFEDGDIIDLYVNHDFWTTVRLTSGGVTMPIPLSAGRNQITLIGKHDGGGGITVKLQTTEGHYFCRPIAKAEQVEVTAVRP